MTIKAFAEKYGINYNLAFEASQGVKPVPTLERNKDFPEDELFDNLIAIYHRKRRFFEQEISALNVKIRSANRKRGETDDRHNEP